MLVPSLLIVALDVWIFAGPLVVVPFAAAAVLAVLAGREVPGARRNLLIAAAVVVAVLGAELPYGTAFKLVTVSGVVSLPISAYAFGRLANLPFPGPALLSVASLALDRKSTRLNSSH